MVALTRNDINKIIYEFDRVHFPHVTKPASRIEGGDNYVKTNLFERHLLEDRGLPVEIVDNIARLHLMSSPSIGALLLYYKGSPTFKRPAEITLNGRCLEGASKALLVHMGIQLAQERTELAGFKQLITLVLNEYLHKLGINDKLEMIRKIEGTTFQIQNDALPPGNTLSDKLAQLKSRLQIDQGRWSKAKVELQLISWRVQLLVARVLDSIFFKIGIGAGTLYCGFRLMIWSQTFKEKFPRVMDKILEAILEDPHSKRNPTLKEVGIVLLGLSSLIGTIVFALVQGEKFLQAYFPNFLAILKTVNWSDPGQWIAGICTVMFFSGEMLAERVARSMDQAVVEAAQKRYVQEKTPSVIEKWTQLVLNQPIQAGSA
ncbi:MAG: hypothetical protein JSS10_05260 [Verrucomicrobia bacterium]|nr:hypothetical protein [Verrucomicrobiota bacterium]